MAAVAQSSANVLATHGLPLIVLTSRIFVTVLALIVGGCALAPVSGPIQQATRPDPARITNYEFNGRISVKQEDRGHYGNIHWVKRGEESDVTLLSPLGQVVARIRSRKNAVTLTLDNNREYQAEDGEALTRQVLGYSVPVSGLDFWLLGSPAPGHAADATLRPDGLLGDLTQQGWRIHYEEYQLAGDAQFPRRMVLDRGDLQIRLVIDQWAPGGGQ